MAAAPCVVFDGDCGFCQRSVAFAKGRDRRGLAFTAWQDADLAPEVLERAKSSVLWIDVWRPDRILDQSAAVIRVLWSLHVGWRIVGTAVWLVPKPLRDLGYRYVARKWGPVGKAGRCDPALPKS